MGGWACSLLTSLSLNTHRWPLPEEDTVLGPLDWPCMPVRGQMPHTHPSHQSQVLN